MKASINDFTKNDKTNALKPENAITIQAGEPGIAGEGSLFLEENLLFFVREGRFSFRYGE